jgi:hypothetical protein
MTNTYNWSVRNIFCYPNVDGKENVIFNVQYSVQATDGINTFTIENSQKLELDLSKNFTPFDQTTEEQVLGWVKTALGNDSINQIKINLDEIVAKLANPPIINPTLPWVKNPSQEPL